MSDETIMLIERIDACMKAYLPYIDKTEIYAILRDCRAALVQQGGPVAVQHMDDDGNCVGHEHWESCDDRAKEWYHIPLYTAPNAAAAQPKHLVRRGLRPDGTYPSADDDEAAAPRWPSGKGDWDKPYPRGEIYKPAAKTPRTAEAKAKGGFAVMDLCDQLERELAAESKRSDSILKDYMRVCREIENMRRSHAARVLP